MQTISEPVTGLVTGHGFYFKVLLAYNALVCLFSGGAFTRSLIYVPVVIAAEMSNSQEEKWAGIPNDLKKNP